MITKSILVVKNWKGYVVRNNRHDVAIFNHINPAVDCAIELQKTEKKDIQVKGYIRKETIPYEKIKKEG